MTQANAVRSLVIAGGGLDAWVTAAALAHSFRSQELEIRVLAQAAGGTPAAEATAPISLAFHQHLGIDEAALMRATSGTFSMGTRFRDWVAPGHDYFQPMGPHGASIEFVHFHNFANKARLAGDATPFNDYSLCAVAARQGRFTHPSNDRNSILSTLFYAHHLDTARYAAFMRDFAMGLGANEIEGEIDDLELDAESGFVRALRLADGKEIAADLFIDCTGHPAALMKRLGNDHVDWSGCLPANRAITARGPAGDTPPHATITATDAGWHQVLPLQQSTAHRFVFREADLAEDAASALLNEAAGGALESEPETLRFTAGHVEDFWRGNCIALGSAAGSFTPLDSARIAALQAGVMRLVTLFPDRDCDPRLADEYNEVTRAEYASVRDFHILHFLAVQRDSDFWTAHRESAVPESLAYKIRLFREHGQVAFYEEESYPDTSWVSVWLGQDQWPKRYDPVLDKYDFERLQGRFSQMRDIIRHAAGEMPAHAAYLRRYCPAD